MPSRNTARNVDLPDSESSGVRSTSDLVSTARFRKVDLEALLAHERTADNDADATIVHASTDGGTLIQASAPPIPPGVRSPISDVPAAPELTVVMQAPPSIPLPTVTVAPAFPPPVAAPIPRPYALEAARIAREGSRRAARRTRWLVVGIWATAIMLAGGLAFLAVSHGSEAPKAPAAISAE